jgi:TRAP-type mannitol/chloroaromatic compound transport system permease small subunit
MKRVLHGIDSINKYLGSILAFFNIGIVVMVCWEIVARYGFNAPTVWATDGMVMLTGYIMILAAGYVQLNKRHVRIDVLYANLGTKTQAVLDIITFFMFSLLMYAIIWHGWLFAWEGIKVRETAGTPWDPIVYPLKTAIPLGAFLLWLQMIADLIRKVYNAFTGKDE